MSWLSSWLFNEPATDAANRATNAAQQQQGQSRQDMLSFLKSGLGQYESAMSNLQSDYGAGMSMLNKGYQSSSNLLQSFLTGQEGITNKVINDTLLATRRQQSSSGLYGGLQETMASTPAIQNALQNFQGQVLQSKLGLEEQNTQNQMGLLQFLMGAQNNLYGGMAGLYGQAMGGAQQQYASASTSAVNAAGMYSQGPLANILDLASTVFSGINAFKPTQSKLGKETASMKEELDYYDTSKKLYGVRNGK